MSSLGHPDRQNSLSSFLGGGLQEQRIPLFSVMEVVGADFPFFAPRSITLDNLVRPANCLSIAFY